MHFYPMLLLFIPTCQPNVANNGWNTAISAILVQMSKDVKFSSGSWIPEVKKSFKMSNFVHYEGQIMCYWWQNMQNTGRGMGHFWRLTVFGAEMGLHDSLPYEDS